MTSLEAVTKSKTKLTLQPTVTNGENLSVFVCTTIQFDIELPGPTEPVVSPVRDDAPSFPTAVRHLAVSQGAIDRALETWS